MTMTYFKLVISLLIVGSLLISGNSIENQQNELANITRIVRQNNHDQNYVSSLKRLFRNSALHIDDQTMQQLQFSLYLMYWKMFESGIPPRRDINSKTELDKGLEKLMNENVSDVKS